MSVVTAPPLVGFVDWSHPQGFGWYILGTTERKITNDIQGGCEIDHKLCCTCLEHKPTRHQLQKYPIHTPNETLKISTVCHKMSSVDHLHAETNMLKVREHSELLSVQYLARCLEPENVNNSITTSLRRLRQTPHNVKHLFNFPAHPTTMTSSDLWNRQVDAIREFSYLEAGVLD